MKRVNVSHQVTTVFKMADPHCSRNNIQPMGVPNVLAVAVTSLILDPLRVALNEWIGICIQVRKGMCGGGWGGRGEGWGWFIAARIYARHQPLGPLAFQRGPRAKSHSQDGTLPSRMRGPIRIPSSAPMIKKKKKKLFSHAKCKSN